MTKEEFIEICKMEARKPAVMCVSVAFANELDKAALEYFKAHGGRIENEDLEDNLM